MDHFAGLDVSVKEISVCIVDDAGNVVREGKLADANYEIADSIAGRDAPTRTCGLGYFYALAVSLWRGSFGQSVGCAGAL